MVRLPIMLWLSNRNIPRFSLTLKLLLESGEPRQSGADVTKRNGTKQNKTEQNKTKQNKTRRN